jgi:hypothetical protein
VVEAVGCRIGSDPLGEGGAGVQGRLGDKLKLEQRTLTAHVNPNATIGRAPSAAIIGPWTFTLLEGMGGCAAGGVWGLILGGDGGMEWVALVF